MRWFLKASADSLSLLPEPSHGSVADMELQLRRFATDRAAMPAMVGSSFFMAQMMMGTRMPPRGTT